MDARTDGRDPASGAFQSLSVRSVEIREAARDDLIGQYGWLASRAGIDTAESMLASASSAFERLARTPGLGAPVRSDRAELSGLRKWRVPGFPRLLILYETDQDRLYVVRVFRAAQDWLVALDRD